VKKLKKKRILNEISPHEKIQAYFGEGLFAMQKTLLSKFGFYSFKKHKKKIIFT
jgi:hypothetical protein